MTNSQIANIVAIVTAAIKAENTGKKSYPAVAKRPAYRNPRISPAVVDAKADRLLKRRASIARGFAAKGIKVTFVKETGRFENVKPYKTWLAEGRIVMKGQHGVKGLFHISQTQEHIAPVVANIPADAKVGDRV